MIHRTNERREHHEAQENIERPGFVRTNTDRITVVENTALQQAIDFFNEEFFAGELPDVFVRYETRANSDGFYTPSGFSARDGSYEKDCIALNSDRFVGKTELQILAELHHLLCHHGQYHLGFAPARHYHDEEWANLMMSADVMPSSTGAAGGKITGKKMSHYVIPGGRFEKACEKLFATGWRLNLQSTPVPGPKVTKKAKDTLICPGCNDRTWSSKRGKRWICPECGYLTILRDAEPSEIKRYRLIEIERDATDASLVRQTETDAPYERPQPVQVPEPAIASYEQQAIEPKRKPGRPKGSKNRKLESVEQPKPRRGRPPGSKNKRKPGRPKGSKNKPKDLPSYDATPGDLR